MNAPSLLLFDLGGVLIENATFDRLAALVPQPLAPSHLKERWLASEAVRRFECGEVAPVEFATSFLAEWEIDLAPQTFLEGFVSWPKGFYPKARELLRQVRQRYRVGCLSNSNILHWERFGGFEEDFDIAMSSHQLGAIKPDRAAFERALGVCGAEPANVCFFDDTMTNVDAARHFGMRAFHVEGFEALLHALSDEALMCHSP